MSATSPQPLRLRSELQAGGRLQHLGLLGWVLGQRAFLPWELLAVALVIRHFA